MLGIKEWYLASAHHSSNKVPGKTRRMAEEQFLTDDHQKERKNRHDKIAEIRETFIYDNNGACQESIDTVTMVIFICSGGQAV